MTPRDYQIASVNAAWRIARDKKNPCIVLPTGAGKSIVIAEICRQVTEQWDGRVVVVQHRKELVEQNAEKIRLMIGQKELTEDNECRWCGRSCFSKTCFHCGGEQRIGTNVGIYSAGLNSRDLEHDVICAGIQSVYKRGLDFGRRQVCIVDECHRIGDDETSQYQQFLGDLNASNPDLIIIGLSATPFRTGEGEITEGSIFHEIVEEAKIDELIARGFLCELTNKPVTHEADMSKVQVRRGEFVQKQMEDEFLREVHGCVADCIRQCQDRKSVIVFCSGVEHAEQVAHLIEQATGDEVGVVVGDTLPMLRASYLDRFKDGHLKWLVNCNVLTEGFDAPNIDAVAMMRATVSPGLFAQAVGRGFRVHPGKENCAVLDYGQNIARHGAINDPEFGRFKKAETEQEGPQKTCPKCENMCPAGCAFCPDCGHAFPEKEQQDIDATHDADNQIIARPEWFDVEDVAFYEHQKRTDPDSITLRVDYQIGFGKFVSEWVCIEHSGFARTKAVDWWSKHSVTHCPETIEEAIELYERGALRVPIRIEAKREGRWWRIVDREFDTEKPTEWASEAEYASQDAYGESDTEIPF